MRYFLQFFREASTGNIPKYKGLDTFKGDTYFTGAWPHAKVDFSGRRVGIIGTGSTGIQVIPVVAQEAAHLTVFQRTPNYSIPSRNAPTDPSTEQEIKAHYPEIRRKERHSPLGLPDDLPTQSAFEVSAEERRRIHERAWQAGGFRLLVDGFKDLLTSREANRTLSEFLAEKIREHVRNPEIAEKLMPTHPFGTKRPALDTDYFETFNRGNVTLVALKATPIEEITPDGIRTRAGEHALDSIIFATGFDAFTGSLLRMNIRGRGGGASGGPLGRRPAHSLGVREPLLPEPVHDLRAAKRGLLQCGAQHRTARRLDRGLHPVHAPARLCEHRAYDGG